MPRRRQHYEDIMDVKLRATLKDLGFKRKSHASYIHEGPKVRRIFEQDREKAAFRLLLEVERATERHFFRESAQASTYWASTAGQQEMERMGYAPAARHFIVERDQRSKP